MASSGLARNAAVALGTLLLAEWGLGLYGLAVVPRAYEDEAWIASTSWKLATQGVFGTDMQGNAYGSATHYFGFMPLYPLLQAGMFRLAGLGLWQARFTSVLLGLVLCALTFALGRRLFGPQVALLAVAGLLLVRTAAQTAYRPTGILLVDLARLGRYDIAVPVLGLAACLALGRAERRGRSWAALAGALGGLAGLAHVYGWFWLPALAAAVVHVGGRRGAGRWAAAAVGALLLGAGLVLLPYLLYVLLNGRDWLGQVSIYRDRLALLDLSWYARNLLTEPQRLGPGFSADWRGWLRPGLGLALFGSGAAAVALVRGRRGRPAPTLLQAAYASALGLLPVLLALLVSSKVANYLLLYLPLAALAGAWGLAAAWQAGQPHHRRWLRALVTLGCAAAALEGLGQWGQLARIAVTTTPYAAYTAQLRAAVDDAAPAARPSVLGLHTYWFGFSDLPFTTWYYPAERARAMFPGAAVPLTVTLTSLAPEIVLVDARTRTWLAAGVDAAPVEAWLAADYRWVGGIDDAPYGRTDVYRRMAAP